LDERCAGRVDETTRHKADWTHCSRSFQTQFGVDLINRRTEVHHYSLEALGFRALQENAGERLARAAVRTAAFCGRADVPPIVGLTPC
jgi:hypothetical protein